MPAVVREYPEAGTASLIPPERMLAPVLVTVIVELLIKLTGPEISRLLVPPMATYAPLPPARSMVIALVTALAPVKGVVAINPNAALMSSA